MRARFWEAKAELEAAMAAAQPLRDERDRMQARIDALVAKQNIIREKVIEAEKPQFELQQEMAALVRALNGKTAIE